MRVRGRTRQRLHPRAFRRGPLIRPAIAGHLLPQGEKGAIAAAESSLFRDLPCPSVPSRRPPALCALPKAPSDAEFALDRQLLLLRRCFGSRIEPFQKLAAAFGSVVVLPGLPLGLGFAPRRRAVAAGDEGGGFDPVGHEAASLLLIGTNMEHGLESVKEMSSLPTDGNGENVSRKPEQARLPSRRAFQARESRFAWPAPAMARTFSRMTANMPRTP